MRRVLLVLLGLGVFAGYGSAFSHARWHARHHHEGGCGRQHEAPPSTEAPVAP